MSRKGTRKAPAKAKGKPKDTNAPKRPQSSYFLFMNERRPILKKEHQDKSMTDISKLISKEWKELADKSEYVDRAAQLKEAHKVALEEYKQTDAFKQYQQKLAAWEDEQKAADSEDEPEARGRGAAKRPSRAAAAKKNGSAAAAKRKKQAAAQDEESELESGEESSSSESEESSSEEEESEEEVSSKGRKKKATQSSNKKGKSK
eukprot:CAMPEP_0197021898 /NCGR_PEP_ID=MMETSP1384-20130603/2779_1 /TAXON_ID=29189 /ORGANISM="Ammonia sp." /LENGTH=203 /DNA_ID=CAMNT_0042449819 /DNA_START=52 /DNA_END=663 /DNA_ORIENTATION=+